MPVTLRRMSGVPRWLAIVWVTAGVVGFAASLAVAAFGARFIGGTARSALEIVEVTRGLLGTAADTAAVVDEIVGESADGLDTVEGSVAAGAETLDDVAGLAAELGTVVTSDVPESLEELRTAMPQLIATAGVVDGVMRTLSFVGVDYDPDAPLDEALRDLDVRLADIPLELRAQADGFAEAAEGIESFAGSTVDIAAEIGTIRQTLVDSRSVLSDYASTIDSGNEILDDLEVRLTDQVDVAQAALVVLGVALAIGQTVPIMLGLWLLGAAHRSVEAAV